MDYSSIYGNATAFGCLICCAVKQNRQVLVDVHTHFLIYDFFNHLFTHIYKHVHYIHPIEGKMYLLGIACCKH
jgi:hypothetical protein